MSSAAVEPLDSARTTNLDEPPIESNGRSKKAEQRSSSGHLVTVDDDMITKIIPEQVFDGVGDGLGAAPKLASDPVAIPSEKDDLCDKEVLI
jgi:hypothetical protein